MRAPSVRGIRWQERAKCAGMETATRDSIFYPEQGQDYRAAKAFCGGDNPCPVAAECLAYALEMTDDEGAWGGYSPAERQALANGAAIVVPIVAKKVQGRTEPKGPPTLTPEDARHGTALGYRYHRCRCDRCRAAATEAKRQERRAS